MSFALRSDQDIFDFTTLFKMKGCVKNCGCCHLLPDRGATVTASEIGRIRELFPEQHDFVRMRRFGGMEIKTEIDSAFRCRFLNRQGGCDIHARCEERGIDFRRFKPLDCVLYPLLFHEGSFYCSDVACRAVEFRIPERREETLLYHSLEMIRHYFEPNVGRAAESFLEHKFEDLRQKHAEFGLGW